jgi:hypothetical protein
MNTTTKRLIFEIGGIILAIVGAFLLIFGAMLPIINPGFLRSADDGKPSFSIGNWVALAIAILLLVSGFICSRTAMRMKALDKSRKANDK